MNSNIFTKKLFLALCIFSSGDALYATMSISKKIRSIEYHKLFNTAPKKIAGSAIVLIACYALYKSLQGSKPSKPDITKKLTDGDNEHNKDNIKGLTNNSQDQNKHNESFISFQAATKKALLKEYPNSAGSINIFFSNEQSTEKTEEFKKLLHVQKENQDALDNPNAMGMLLLDDLEYLP